MGRTGGAVSGQRLGRFVWLSTSVFFLLSTSGIAKGVPKGSRDPRQMAFLIADFDGTTGLNVGHIRLKRSNQLESVSPFFLRAPTLPEEILIPVDDFEGNVGPQIAKRIGRIDEGGRFLPSTSLDPIRLSNGKFVVPGYYYLDPQSSYREFREPADGEPDYFRAAIDEKLKHKTPFLLDAFPFMSLTFREDLADRVAGAILTKRGHGSLQMANGFDRLRKPLRLGKRKWEQEAFVNLSHPDFADFGGSKNKYLEGAFHALTDRMITDRTTPHYFVFFENDRAFLREADALFTKLANQGVFANPVVPVLVNLVEKEVFQNPDGVDWDRSPMHKNTKMSRVSIYQPGRVDRSDDLAVAMELILHVDSATAKKFLKEQSKNPFLCVQSLIFGME